MVEGRLKVILIVHKRLLKLLKKLKEKDLNICQCFKVILFKVYLYTF